MSATQKAPISATQPSDVPIDRPDEPRDPSEDAPLTDMSRRALLRGAALAGGGIVAASLAACAPGTTLPTWSYSPVATPGAGGSPGPGTPAPTPAGSAAPTPAATGGGSLPPGWTSHDIAARNVIRRYVGNLAPALQGIYGDAAFAKLVDILGATEAYPELQKKPAFAQVPQLVLNDALKPLTPTVEGDVKVFRLTIDLIDQVVDEMKPPIPALGYNGQTPGPTIRVTEGDKVRVIFTNNLQETTGVHFHGVEFEDFFQDGVPFVTQKPFAPGESYTYEFTANRSGSMMYHSHHNATDQVGRGLLGAFIVDPRNPTEVDRVDRDYIWISNDVLGGFTINGHGFPAVVPILAAVGEKVRVRFMNEGIMYHPFHSHGYKQTVVARDGYPLGAAAYGADTITVGPGERWDVNIETDRIGLWAFHCHILPHVEGVDGMFGMVNVLIVVPRKEHVDAIVKLLVA
ncbi:MAG TPA: multicopper oxidase domain-containing protein [Candidatus Limnocylindrales bacterium]|nr:multicopper oxidase domain-containing protein [Candidatus Limnocylindrales bacterium]